MQKKIDELLAEVEKYKTENWDRISELEKKNSEYKKALVAIRQFNCDDEEHSQTSGSIVSGHNLLGNGGKVLVLGAVSLPINTMRGIAKLYGFEKRDFVFETEYCKIRNFTGRMANGKQYSAVILGATPHKVANLGDWSSIVEKCKNDDNMPLAIDARSKSGELKVTKESFREALIYICKDLKKKKIA